MKHLVLIATFSLMIPLLINAQSKNFIDQPYVSVTSTADSLVTPDRIYIKIILSEKDAKDKWSLKELENKMIAALENKGINTKSDLTVNDMLSNFRSHFLRQKDIVMTQEYMLKVADAATAGIVFARLEELGISNLSIDRVEHSDIENIKNLCMAKAVENAKDKAIALTKPLNQKIGTALFISDNDGRIDVANLLQGRVAGVNIAGSGNTKLKGYYESPAIEFNKIKVKATVNVIFALY